jgi:Na+-driven multidrug efflux pump
LGAAQLAGFGIAVRLEYLLYPLAFGLGAGVLGMVGTNIGAGNFARAGRIAWTAAALAALITGSIGIFGVTLPDIWAGLFTDAPDIHGIVARYLVITGGAYAFIGLGLVLATAFQAAGRPLWPLIGITSRAVVVATGGWAALHFANSTTGDLGGVGGVGGLGGLAVAAAAGLTVYGTSLAAAFRAGFWQSRRPLSAQMPSKA